MRNRVYFITDAHLGSGTDSPQRERQLCALLDTFRADAKVLVILGDMFDFWFSYRHVVPRGHVRLLGKLAQMADDGVELHYFIGNHDMWLFDYLPSEFPVVMHTDPSTLTIRGRRFLVGHGDGLGHLDRRYDVLRWVFRNSVNQWLFSLLPSSLTFGVALRWSRHSKRHHNPDHLHYLGDDREGIVLFCKQQLLHADFDFCVFGHRHTPHRGLISVLRPNGQMASSVYVNVGDWLSNRNYAYYDFDSDDMVLMNGSQEVRE